MPTLPAEPARRRLLRQALLSSLAAPAFTAGCVHAAASRSAPGFDRPFSADSPWNIRPLAPRLASYVLPPTRYLPYCGPSAYSTGVFRARPADPPVRIAGPVGSQGVWCPDEGLFRDPLVLPHWPASVLPASGEDGHAEIIDEAAGLVHSFWQLRAVDGGWRATQYAWSALGGRGWPDPAHYHQGARAAGVPACGGLIRAGEIDDGSPYYLHALAISLDGSALERGYVYPAGNEDGNALERYRGAVPMGSLLLLPPTFDAASLNLPALRKVARTLMRFGARVVDQNTDTRFAMYVENGARFDVHGGRWNPAAAADLVRIADALRPLAAPGGWLDADERPVDQPPAGLNLLSLRGPWQRERGDAPAAFDSWRQALVFGPGSAPTRYLQRTGEGARRTRWAPWRAGTACRLRVSASDGARLQCLLVDDAADERLVWDSGELSDGQSADVMLPAGSLRPVLRATSGSPRGSSVSAAFEEHSGARSSAR